MTVKVATERKEPHGITHECVACRNQQPSMTHVDFDAEADRGWYGDDPSTEVSLEDIIICEGCVKEAARLVGMVEQDDRVGELERKLDVERKLRRQAQNYADTMEDALSKRPEKVHIDHRKMPRKQIGEMV